MDTHIDSGIYVITCTATGYKYCGSSRTLSKRFLGHKTLLRHGKHRNKLMQEHFDTYGEESFIYSVIEYIPVRRDYLLREEAVTRELQKEGKCYNKYVLANFPGTREMIRPKDPEPACMTKDEFIQFGTRRHGPEYLKPLAEETGYSFSQLWRISKGQQEVSRRLEKSLANLPERPRKRQLDPRKDNV